MKKIVFMIAFVTMGLFPSCEKDQQGPEYTIHTEIQGSNVIAYTDDDITLPYFSLGFSCRKSKDCFLSTGPGYDYRWMNRKYLAISIDEAIRSVYGNCGGGLFYIKAALIERQSNGEEIRIVAEGNEVQIYRE